MKNPPVQNHYSSGTTEMMMKLIVFTGLLLALAAPGQMTASAITVDEVFKGTLVCAKCGLKKADALECQDVLLVEDGKGTTAEYYITKNEVAEKSGEACTLKVPATVTGSVSQKDGKTWLTPSKIEKH
jgi:hypothetical protein